MEENEVTDKEKQNISRGDKIKEIVVGFFLGILTYVILGIISMSIQSYASAWISGLAFLLFIFYFFIKGRKYFAIGLILSVVIPLITVGGCLYFIGLR